MDKEMLDNIRTLIGRSRIDEALEKLQQHRPASFGNEVLLLTGRFEDLQRKDRIGILMTSERNAEWNKITIALLELLDRIERWQPQPQPQAGSPDVPPQEPTPEKPKIYFSYAWGREVQGKNPLLEMPNRLYKSLLEEGYSVQRDSQEIAFGGSISDYMEELGAGDLVVVFISEQYVKSPYCMFELFEIARNSKWEQAEFRTRILPIPIEQIRFDRPDVLDKYMTYWNDELEKWENFMSKNSRSATESQSKRFHNTKAILQHFGKLADWLSNTNAMNLELLSENDFEIVKAAIMERLRLLQH